MATIYWMFGISITSLVVEKVMKEFGNETKANYVNIATNLIMLALLVRAIFDLFNLTTTIFSRWQ